MRTHAEARGRAAGRTCSGLILIGIFLAGVGARASDAPDPREILDSVRLAQSGADLDFEGVIRSGPARVPFRLAARGGTITYRFVDPPETLRLRLGDNEAFLERELAGRITPVSVEERAQPVRGTDVTLQDVSLDFLYWPDVELLGEQIVGPRRTWKIRLRAPTRDMPYAAVMAFVDQAGGALMQMDAYGWDGKLLRRFRVTSGQQVDGVWMLKQMRVERLDPATGKVLSRTYLEVAPAGQTP